MDNNNSYWTKNFSYALGLFTADGCLSGDKRHLEFTSKDQLLVQTFANCWNLTNTITKKYRSNEKIKKYFRIQFGNVKLYKFLNNIGLTSRKSLSIKKVDIPNEFFADFVRGLFDGDGNINQSRHTESQHLQLRIRFFSASPDFLRWVHEQIKNRLQVSGFLQNHTRVYVLTFGKADSIKLIRLMHYQKDLPYLARKHKIAMQYL